MNIFNVDLIFESKALVGKIYSIKQEIKQPGILLLSGSDGKTPGENAIPASFIEYIVNQGFVVFGLAYFAEKNLPDFLENIDLEYFQSAVSFFRSFESVDSSTIHLIGQSRGGELALLLGCYFKDSFTSITAIAPCHSICGGFPHPNVPAWIYKKQALKPFLGGFSTKSQSLTEAQDLQQAMMTNHIPYHENTQNDPCNIADLFHLKMHELNVKLCEIEVEKIECPIFLLSGDLDEIWPSHFFCQSITKRLKEKKFKYPVQHINYTQAGHGILASFNGSIYHPIGGFWCKLGGSEEGNLKANQNSWGDIAVFLVSHN